MFSQSCVSGFHRISDHGESRRARLSATTTPSWRHIWSSTHTKRPSLDHTRNCQPSPNQLSNFNLQQGSPPPTQSLPQIPSSTRTNDPTSLDHPPTPNTSPPSSTRQISNFLRVTTSHPILVTDSVIHAHKRPHIIPSSTHGKYQSTIQHSSNFNFLRGHHLPPIDYARPRRQQAPISTIHLALFVDPFLIWGKSER